MYFKSSEKKECSGCTACVSVCPRQCISMRVDEEGFYYPSIDHTACINCGLCERVCSFEHPKYDNNLTPELYAAYLKDEGQRMQSTSGGVFYAVAHWVIEQGGIVYGAAFDDDFKLLHVGVDNLEDLSKLRGSKYLQSYLGNTFTEIKMHLDLGRWVYFVGTGCQVAGLKAFIRKKTETLITSDLVCHGVPSQKMFDWHLNYLRNKINGEIISYSFRDCAGWGGCETYKYVTRTRKEKIKRLYSYSLSPYLYSFMNAFNFRYCCYECKFAKMPRQGDITLADFWSVRKYFPNLDRSKGVSLVSVNSFMGKNIWDMIKNALEYHLSCVEYAVDGNRNLLHPTVMPEIRKTFYNRVEQYGYRELAEKFLRSNDYYKLKIKYFLLQSPLGVFLKKMKRNKKC